MTQLIRLPKYSAAMAAVFCLATLAPTVSNEAAAQTIRVYGSTHGYNGYGQGYNSGYGNRHSGYSHNSGYGYNSRRGYTGYGNGPYAYGASSPYMRPGLSTDRYGYRSGASYGFYYRGLRFGGGNYIRNNARYYSPYGYRGF